MVCLEPGHRCPRCGRFPRTSDLLVEPHSMAQRTGDTTFPGAPALLSHVRSSLPVLCPNLVFLP